MNAQELFLLLGVSVVVGLVFGLVLKRKRIVGDDAARTLPLDVDLTFGEIGEGRARELASQVRTALSPYADGISEQSGCRFRLMGVTVSLGEIHQQVLASVTAQPIEFSGADVALHYTSLLAAGHMEVIVTVRASPGSQVQLQGSDQTISIGQSGEEQARVRVTKEQLQKGQIEGTATKGGLSKKIMITLS